MSEHDRPCGIRRRTPAEMTGCATRCAAVARSPSRPTTAAQVENLFNRYMYLHNAFQDEQIIPLWVTRRHARASAPATRTPVSTRRGRA